LAGGGETRTRCHKIQPSKKKKYQSVMLVLQTKEGKNREGGREKSMPFLLLMREVPMRQKKNKN